MIFQGNSSFNLLQFHIFCSYEIYTLKYAYISYREDVKIVRNSTLDYFSQLKLFDKLQPYKIIESEVIFINNVTLHQIKPLQKTFYLIFKSIQSKTIKQLIIHMDANTQTLKNSLKLIKDFTSWQRTSSTHSLVDPLSQQQQDLERSYNSTYEAPTPTKKYLRLQRNGSMFFIHKKEESVINTEPYMFLEKSKSEQIQQRFRTQSQVILKSDVDRQAMKSRLQSKVQLAEKKLAQMRQGFKRRVMEKQQIVKKVEPQKPPKLIYR